MERGGLVVEHDVVGAGDAHDEVDPGHTQQGQQGVHVILVSLGVVGVADIATHRHAQQLAAEVVFQACADDLLAVVQVLGADEPDHRVDQERLEMACHGIGAGFAGLLVDAVVGIGRQGAALAGLEVHEVLPQGAALERQARLIAFLQHVQVDTEAGVGGLGSGDRLEHQVQRHATVDGLDRRGDVGQHAGLGRDVIALDNGVEHFQQGADRGDAVGGRVDADHGIAVTVQQAVEDAGGNPGRFIRGVVGLQACRQAPTQPHGAAKTGHYTDFLRDQHQVLHAHDLRHGGGHFRGEPRRQGAQAGLGGFIAEQPVAQAADGEVADRGKGLGVVGVDDQAGDLVLLVRDQRFTEKMAERNVGQGHLRGDPFPVVGGSNPCQVIP